MNGIINLVLRRSNQISFNLKEKIHISIYYILNYDNVDFETRRDNQKQGIWGFEKNFHFCIEMCVPEYLKRNMHTGVKSMVGLITGGEMMITETCKKTKC